MKRTESYPGKPPQMLTWYKTASPVHLQFEAIFGVYYCVLARDLSTAPNRSPSMYQRRVNKASTKSPLSYPHWLLNVDPGYSGRSATHTYALLSPTTRRATTQLRVSRRHSLNIFKARRVQASPNFQSWSFRTRP